MTNKHLLCFFFMFICALCNNFMIQYAFTTILRQQKILQEVYQKLLGMGHQSDTCFNLLSQTNSSQSIMTILTNKQCFYFFQIAEQSYKQWSQINQYFQVNVNQIIKKQKEQKICIVNVNFIQIKCMFDIGINYVEKLTSLFMEFGVYKPFPFISVFQRLGMQCREQAARKQTKVDNFLYGKISHMNLGTNSSILMDKIREYTNCWNFCAAEDLVDNSIQFTKLLSQVVDNYESDMNYLNQMRAKQFCFQHHILQKQRSSGQKYYHFLQHLGNFLQQASQYKYYGKLNLPVATVIRIMQQSQRIKTFNQKYLPKMEKILSEYRKEIPRWLTMECNYDKPKKQWVTLASEINIRWFFELQKIFRKIGSKIQGNGQFNRLNQTQIIILGEGW